MLRKGQRAKAFRLDCFRSEITHEFTCPTSVCEREIERERRGRSRVKERESCAFDC